MLPLLKKPQTKTKKKKKKAKQPLITIQLEMYHTFPSC